MGKRFNYKRLSVKQLNDKYVKKSKFLRRFMDGYPHNNEEKVGYCWLEEHKGFLTLDLIERHHCLDKKCKHLQMYYETIKTKNGIELGKKIQPQSKHSEENSVEEGE